MTLLLNYVPKAWLVQWQTQSKLKLLMYSTTALAHHMQVVTEQLSFLPHTLQLVTETKATYSRLLTFLKLRWKLA